MLIAQTVTANNKTNKMRQIILVFSFILILNNSVKSQIIQGVKISSGIAISGIDYQLNNNVPVFNKELIGLTTGLEVSYFDHQLWKLNSRISYTERGGTDIFILSDQNGNKTGEESSRFLFNYMSLNTTIDFRYKTSLFEPNISIGPRIDYLINSTNSSDKYKKMNYGFDLGLGFDKNVFDKLVLSLDFIWSYQINKIADNSVFVVTPKGGYLINFGIGYKI
jgi:hypothetical protein